MEAGKKIWYEERFLSKAFCLEYARTFKAAHEWEHISDRSLAAEIFFHAVLYYKGISAVMPWLRLAGSTVTDAVEKMAASVGDGIDVENGRDTRIVCGIQRWRVYEGFYLICHSW